MSPTYATIALILAFLACAFALSEWFARRAHRAGDEDPTG